MAIACGHCQGAHDTPAEVRACWSGAAVPAADTPAAPERAAVVPRPTLPSVAAGPGPNVLARGAVVAPGADPGEPWSTCERIRVNAAVLADPENAIEQLTVARDERRRVVIELDADVDPHRPPSPVERSEPHLLGPRFRFASESLHQLVWANSVDLRDPATPRWSLLDRAVEAGVEPVTPGDEGDIRLADGTPLWLDGGPPRFTAAVGGVAVVSGLAVGHGPLAAPIDNDSDALLAPDQVAAVTHDTGAARIIAPAGSGKTRVLTERARHLLTRWNLPAAAVTLVAFNKRAQEEMRERTSDLPALQVRTLNSIALAIVNGTAPFAPRPQRWATIDEPEVRRLIGDLVRFPHRRNSDPVAPWIEGLSMVRLGLRRPEEVESAGAGDVDGFADFYPHYLAQLERRGQVDFDDQIRRALVLLLTDPEARAVARRACRVLLVDEFQDLTPAHLLLVRLLSGPDGAVFGVGDDDQTIYGYNGADPAWLIEFSDLFPGAGAHPLEVNYRCPAGVVDAVDRLLRHNRRRVTKTIRAASGATPGWSADRRPDVVAATTDAVRSSLAAGRSPRDVAVLARVNAALVGVQAALVADELPFRGGAGLEFMDRTAVRSVLAWIRLAVTEARSGSLVADDIREALRRPSRSLHPRITDWVGEQTDVAALFRLAGRLNKERDSERVTGFAADVQRLARRVGDSAPTSDIVSTLIDEMGLGGSVSSLDTHRRGMNRSAQGDDLTAIAHLAALHDDVLSFESWLRGTLATPRTADGVLLATVHRVKGQEWPRVVVHQADPDQFPHRLAEDVEEERRLFHVALTRASEHVTVTTGPRPTPFLEELTTEPTPHREVTAHVAERVERKRRSASTATADDLDPQAQIRFEALRELRGRLRDGKPAYVVFDNKTLVAIARDAPTTETELRHVPGVGPAKLERYGESVLELMRAMT